MSKIEWFYHRKNCVSCSRAAAFLAEHQVQIQTQVDARTVPLIEQDALRLVAESSELYVTRGSKVIHFDLTSERPDDVSILELLIGRSGKLRAPSIKSGHKLVVGFDKATYEAVLC